MIIGLAVPQCAVSPVTDACKDSALDWSIHVVDDVPTMPILHAKHQHSNYTVITPLNHADCLAECFINVYVEMVYESTGLKLDARELLSTSEVRCIDSKSRSLAHYFRRQEVRVFFSRYPATRDGGKALSYRLNDAEDISIGDSAFINHQYQLGVHYQKIVPANLVDYKRWHTDNFDKATHRAPQMRDFRGYEC